MQPNHGRFDQPPDHLETTSLDELWGGNLDQIWGCLDHQMQGGPSHIFHGLDQLGAANTNLGLESAKFAATSSNAQSIRPDLVWLRANPRRLQPYHRAAPANFRGGFELRSFNQVCGAVGLTSDAPEPTSHIHSSTIARKMRKK